MRILQMTNFHLKILDRIFGINHIQKDVPRCWKYEILGMRKHQDLVLNVVRQKDGRFTIKFQVRVV